MGNIIRITHPIQDQRVFDVVTRVTHDCDRSVLASRELIVPDEFDCLGFHHRLLRIHHQIEECVDPVQLVVCNCPDGLFTHSALVGVPRGLIVVWVRNETCHRSENSEGFDLEMSRGGLYRRLIEGNVGVILLVHVKVFN